MNRAAAVLTWVVLACVTAAASGQPPQPGESNSAEPDSAPTIHWLDDYKTAYRQAEQSNKSLLIWFTRDSQEAPPNSRGLWEPVEIRKRLNRFVPLRVTTSAQFDLEGEPTVLIKHSSFAEMHGRPGIAIVDLDGDSPWFRQVVTVYPESPQAALTARELGTLLDLPQGSLTQRTLIFAVRMHPELPQSTSGELSSMLAAEAESHSQHQAAILLQGHHQWEERFYKINDRLPQRMVSTEVCAESWPGKTLLEAAIDCVHSWRQSSGHWDAVSRRHRFFGYDIKRGSNGIWYATGIFGDERQ